MKYGHLERIDLKLRALAPVFIGSGDTMTKKQYILDGDRGLIHFPHFAKLLDFLKQREMLKKYEEFLVNPRNSDFKDFLAANSILRNDWPAFTRYSIAAGEALKDVHFRDVHMFVKDSQGFAYIPGSSLKGALRTAIAAYRVKKGNFQEDARSIENADMRVPPRKYLNSETSRLEKKLFYRLGIKDRNENLISSAINDIMQGIRISDSGPLGFENLTLAGKYDRKPDGSFKTLPIFRECLIPGSEARFAMTLDLPILKKAGLDATAIEESLHCFADDYYANYEQYFTGLDEDADTSAQKGVDLILGGGAGYASKTLTYNIFSNRDKALQAVSKILSLQFRDHKHGADPQRYKVSPSVLKTTRYKEQFFQMGRCELIFGNK